MALKRTSAKYGSLICAVPPCSFLDDENVKALESFGVYVEATMDTIITMQVKTNRGWKDYESIQLAAGEYDFFNIWSAPFETIQFVCSTAGTVYFEIVYKT